MNPALRGLFALLMLLAAGWVHAQEGEPVSDEVVRDREFGVSARHFGLELMGGWQRSTVNLS